MKIKQAVLVLFMLMLVYLIMSCSSISTKTYRVTTPLLHEESSIKIVLISDLHSTIFGTEQDVLINKIINLNPDLIIMSGDIFCSNNPMTGAQLFLSGISGIAPVYFVTGNHEYWSHNIQAIRNMLVQYGVIILSDNYVIIEVNNYKIVIAGIEDPERSYFETTNNIQNNSIENAFRELDEVKLYKILVAHRPEMIEIYKKYSFDLVLSGHTHGGQVRMPFGLYAPNQGFFPKYSGGIYKHNELTHIISRGLSVNHPKFPRIFNPPEIVFIVIEPEN